MAVAAGDVVITGFGISVRHLERLLGGLLLANSPRVDWAKGAALVEEEPDRAQPSGAGLRQFSIVSR